MQTSREHTLALVDAVLTSGPGDVAARVQSAVHLWIDATIVDDDAEARDRFERRLADALEASNSVEWCDGEVTVLDLARTLHTCARIARLYAGNALTRAA
jgi:hypothetical protein